MEPSAAPAPIMVWSSSMKMMASFAAASSSIIFFKRCSNSPRYLVPATTEAKSKAKIRLLERTSEISPWAIFRAKPSTIAVLPTPGSPISTGLFFVRRANICTKRSISSSRPITGSSLFWAANFVRSRVYSSNVGVLLLLTVVSRSFLGVFKLISCEKTALSSFKSPESASPIKLSTVSRTESKLRPKLANILPAIPSSSRIRPSKICSVPIWSEPNIWDSSTDSSKTFLARGVKGISPSSIIVSPMPTIFSISWRTLRNVTPKPDKILLDTVPSKAERPSKICSVPT